MGALSRNGIFKSWLIRMLKMTTRNGNDQWETMMRWEAMGDGNGHKEGRCVGSIDRHDKGARKDDEHIIEMRSI